MDDLLSRVKTKQIRLTSLLQELRLFRFNKGTGLVKRKLRIKRLDRIFSPDVNDSGWSDWSDHSWSDSSWDNSDD